MCWCHKQPQDLTELVDAVLNRLPPLLRDGQHEVKVSLQPNMPLVSCDYAAVDQIVTNLVENAARHTPVGTAIEIRVAASEADGVAYLDVIDHRRGVPSADRERIFRASKSTRLPRARRCWMLLPSAPRRWSSSI